MTSCTSQPKPKLGRALVSNKPPQNLNQRPRKAAEKILAKQKLYQMTLTWSPNEGPQIEKHHLSYYDMMWSSY